MVGCRVKVNYLLVGSAPVGRVPFVGVFLKRFKMKDLKVYLYVMRDILKVKVNNSGMDKCTDETRIYKLNILIIKCMFKASKFAHQRNFIN